MRVSFYSVLHIICVLKCRIQFPRLVLFDLFVINHPTKNIRFAKIAQLMNIKHNDARCSFSSTKNNSIISCKSDAQSQIPNPIIAQVETKCRGFSIDQFGVFINRCSHVFNSSKKLFGKIHAILEV